ncbi:META domain-containing protein [Sphingobacterium corticis]|uniref:Type IV secretion system putative lipoprotein virB7 n=1 Tax=Sphingobacterium corticis TaxID=1812823 RepID=A0ABW5NEK9_9SPHI
MKRLLLFFVSIAVLTSCSKDDDKSNQDYSTQILGTWEMTHYDGRKVSDNPEVFPDRTTITFQSGGTYSGSGMFGDGSGTYTLSGNTITTKVDGLTFITYKIKSINGDTADLTMNIEQTSADIRAVRVR